ncbi:phage portal protein [Candidatus Pacearchaeota archaeon]|nr:phage portal protein [Candidatus Pacearchaeota archaeon]
MGLYTKICDVGGAVGKVGGAVSKVFGGGHQKSVSDSMSWNDQMRFFRDKQTDGPFIVPSDREMLEYYRTNSLVYACIKLKSSAFQSAPLVLQSFDTETKEWITVDDHDLKEPLTGNKFLSESEIKQYVDIHLNTTGKSFLWKWQDQVQTRELWPIPPQWVTINTVENIDPNSNKRVIESFTVQTDTGKEFILTTDEMIYNRFVDPINLWDGLSPLSACSKNVQMDDNALNFQANAIESLNLPGMIINTKKPMNPTQRADLRSILAQKMGDSVGSNVLILNGTDVEYQVVNTVKDLDWSNLNNLNESRICMAFGVPPVVVGAVVGLENSPWSNIKEAQRWFYKQTMVSEWDLVASGFTRSLIPPNLQNEFRFIFDTDQIQELKEDIAVTREFAIGLFNDGLITRNAALKMLSLIETADGNVYKYKNTDVLIPVGADMSNETTDEEQQNGIDQIGDV